MVVSVEVEWQQAEDGEPDEEEVSRGPVVCRLCTQRVHVLCAAAHRGEELQNRGEVGWRMRQRCFPDYRFEPSSLHANTSIIGKLNQERFTPKSNLNSN